VTSEQVAGAVTPVYKFEPDGTVFQQPVTVTFLLANATPPLAVFWSKPDKTGYEQLTSTFGTGSIAAQISHFSTGYVAPIANNSLCFSQSAQPLYKFPMTTFDGTLVLTSQSNPPHDYCQPLQGGTVAHVCADDANIGVQVSDEGHMLWVEHMLTGPAVQQIVEYDASNCSFRYRYDYSGCTSEYHLTTSQGGLKATLEQVTTCNRSSATDSLTGTCSCHFFGY
jgi:hypothetical protein